LARPSTNWPQFHANPAVNLIVIPAKAGTHSSACELAEKWIPAFAGMTITGKGWVQRGFCGTVEPIEQGFGQRAMMGFVSLNSSYG